MENLNNTLSKQLRESILNRACETHTGYLKIPSDLVKRVKKETGTTEPNWKINAEIQRFVNANS